jgi:hypothetical protein
MTTHLQSTGQSVRLDLVGKTARVEVRGGDEPATTIEISPTGSLPGEYFVGTFDGGRFIGLVRLGEDYPRVGELDFVQMVQWTRDTSRFPRIAAVATDEGRRLEIEGGGLPTRVEVRPLPEAA